MRHKPVILTILDGFGVSVDPAGNPVFEAKTPAFDTLDRDFPFTTLQASGVAVGLPWGEAGNSEVGHLTIGAGRVFYHHLPRIINAIKDGSFFTNEALLKVAEHVRKNNSSLHVAGLVSSGSVHAYVDHLYAVFDFAKKQGIKSVYLHIFSDGKDAPPKEGVEFLGRLEERLSQEWPDIHIASVIGRAYALDRDEKWDRIRKTYELLVEGKGVSISSLTQYLIESYARDVTDEFIEPAMIAGQNADPMNSRIKDGDALIISDFREDSMREITRAFVEEVFDYFPRRKLQNFLVATMTEYQKGLSALPVFPPVEVQYPLSRVIGEAGLRHLHIAETQKYAHVTYFLNSGREVAYTGEERMLVPSLNVAHFDEAPMMQAEEILKRILENFDTYDVFIVNFANADMVGHTGNFEAAVQAVEALDAVVGKLMSAVLARPESAMIITADHGNIELKRNIRTGEKLTEHSLNPVPFYLVGAEFKRKNPATPEEILEKKSQTGGILTDVAPSVLELLDLPEPSEMTGKSLIQSLIKKT